MSVVPSSGVIVSPIGVSLSRIMHIVILMLVLYWVYLNYHICLYHIHYCLSYVTIIILTLKLRGPPE